MAIRIRKDGRVLCAAMHPERGGDTYLDDRISYVLTVDLGALVSEDWSQSGGRGGHSKHGEWWWAHEVPNDVVIDPKGWDAWPTRVARFLGRRGGMKGGKARAESLSPERRSEIARHAAQVRWAGAQRKDGDE